MRDIWRGCGTCEGHLEGGGALVRDTWRGWGTCEGHLEGVGHMRGM